MVLLLINQLLTDKYSVDFIYEYVTFTKVTNKHV